MPKQPVPRRDVLDASRDGLHRRQHAQVVLAERHVQQRWLPLFRNAHHVSVRLRERPMHERPVRRSLVRSTARSVLLERHHAAHVLGARRLRVGQLSVHTERHHLPLRLLERSLHERPVSGRDVLDASGFGLPRCEHAAHLHGGRRLLGRQLSVQPARQHLPVRLRERSLHWQPVPRRRVQHASCADVCWNEHAAHALELGHVHQRRVQLHRV